LKKYIISVFVSVSGFAAYAQPDMELKKMSAAFPNEHSVILKDKQDIRIELVKGKLDVKMDKYIEYMYLDNVSGMYSEQSIDYSELDKITEISAATLSPSKSKYIENKVKDFAYDDKISKSVFYDGGKTISFIFPSITPGSKSWLKYSQELSEPRLMPSFYPQERIPVKESELTIFAPENVEIGWKAFNASDSAFTFTKSKEKGKVKYHWQFNNVPKFRFEADAPGLPYHTPHIAYWIKSYTVDGKTQPVLGTVKDLYSWYSGLAAGVNKSGSKEMQNTVDSLIAGEKDELTRVKKIYYWVQDNIKYIAFEDGMGGFIPRTPEEVCHRRYGDCKDMATLIHSMLTYAKITSHLTWIGSRRLPYRYEELSTPGVDDHMICTYINNGKNYFLDGTGQHLPFGWPNEFIQGKEALIGIDQTNYKIATVPVMNDKDSQLRDSVTIRIEEDKLTGKGSSLLTGYEKINMTYRLSGNEKDFSKILREYYSKGNNKFLLTSSKVENLGVKDADIKISYDFNIADYLTRNDKETYVNLHLNKEMIKMAVAKDRVLDVEKDYNRLQDYTVTLQIPAGHKVTYLPESKEFKDPRFGFEIKYKQVGKTVVLTEKYYCNTLFLTSADFQKWNNMVQELKNAYTEVVILLKN
jgi:hypothetical protein